jgi:hypothetical protein
MVLFDYVGEMLGGVEFLIALGSIIGLLGLIAGFIGVLVMPRFRRQNMIFIIIVSIILLIICGLDTGLRYFGIRI